MTVAEIIVKLDDIDRLRDETYSKQVKTEDFSEEFRYFDAILDMLLEYKDTILKLKVVER